MRELSAVGTTVFLHTKVHLVLLGVLGRVFANVREVSLIEQLLGTYLRHPVYQ